LCPIIQEARVLKLESWNKIEITPSFKAVSGIGIFWATSNISTTDSSYDLFCGEKIDMV